MRCNFFLFSLESMITYETKWIHLLINIIFIKKYFLTKCVIFVRLLIIMYPLCIYYCYILCCLYWEEHKSVWTETSSNLCHLRQFFWSTQQNIDLDLGFHIWFYLCYTCQKWSILNLRYIDFCYQMVLYTDDFIF